jgi:NAD+ synthase (glutamine-hydrolysing)
MKATPTAELRPLRDGLISQTDEEDMGLTYHELSLFGNLRRLKKLGPVSMFNEIHSSGAWQIDVRTLAEKVKHFFRCYANNRHKITVLTPAFHFNPETCDDSRVDPRPFLYQTSWEYQFELIDSRAEEIEKTQTCNKDTQQQHPQ